jgi:hypothetical protein
MEEKVEYLRDFASKRFAAKTAQARVPVLPATCLKLSHKSSLWVAASAATFRDLKNKGFSP